MLQGVLNARDLGGIRIGDKTVRSGLLLRTAHLNDATDEDVRHLSEDLHLKKIFDFRTFQESSAQPDRPPSPAQSTSCCPPWTPRPKSAAAKPSPKKCS